MRNISTKITGLSILLFFCTQIAQAQFEVINYPGAIATYITGMNDEGDYVGYFDDGSGYMKGFANILGQNYTVIEWLGTNDTYCEGINNNRAVIGKYNLTGDDIENEGFYWNYLTDNFTDNFTQTVLFGTEYITIGDINIDSFLVGSYKIGTTREHWTWAPGYALDAQQYMDGGGNVLSTYGMAINDLGFSAGYYIDGGTTISYLYLGGGTYQTFQIPGSNKTKIMGLNNQFDVVGDYSNTNGFVCFSTMGGNPIWQNFNITGAIEEHPMDINEHRQICGYFVDANGTHGFIHHGYDLEFRPTVDGWNFENSQTNMWTFDEYGSIFYVNDPWMWSEHQIAMEFPTVDGQDYPNQTFPSWPLFVQAYSEVQCYHYTGVHTRNAIAEQKWKDFVKPDWKGSCRGFTYTSLMAFDDRNTFNANYPSAGNITGDLYSANLTPGIRNAINKSQCYTIGKNQVAFKAAHVFDGAVLTDQFLREMMSDTIKNDYGLSIQNVGSPGGGGHALVAYKINVGTIWDTVFVYDNNFPGDETRQLYINKEDDYYLYEGSINSGGNPVQWGSQSIHNGIYVTTKAMDESGMVDLGSIEQFTGGGVEATDDYVSVYMSQYQEEIIHNSGGQITGYEDSLTSWGIIGAAPLYYEDGTVSKPFAYTLPINDSYNIEMKESDSSRVYCSVYDNDQYFGFERSGADPSQTDLLDYFSSTGMGYSNPDNISKNIQLKSFGHANDVYFNYWLNDVDMSQNDSIHWQLVNEDELLITNFGGATDYDLEIQIVTTTDVMTFEYDNIPFDPTTSHHIVPEWDSLATAEIMIIVDGGINGTADDTLFYQNQSLPELAMSNALFSKNKFAGSDTVNVDNVGGGIMNWTITSTASWLQINSSSSNTDFATVDFSYDENTTGTDRLAMMLITSNAPSSPDTITLMQTSDSVIAVAMIGKLDFDAQIYPNPAQHFIQLNIQNPENKPVNVIITDINGKTIDSFITNLQLNQLIIASLPQGTYNVTLYNGEKMLSKQFVKIK